MPYFRFAGKTFFLQFRIMGLKSLELKKRAAVQVAPFLPDSNVSSPNALISKATGWIAGSNRQIIILSSQTSIHVYVEGGSDFYVSPFGRSIACKDLNEKMLLSETDQQIFLGPVIVFALALQSTWCLHASAARYRNKTIAFLGESGQGKSTLAAYLAGQPKWQLVADDILPVALEKGKLQALPHFPQLKLPMESQPGPGLPERLPLERICLLTEAGPEAEPKLELLPANQAAQVLLSHTAGTRLFTPELLAQHLQFCARTATRVNVYRLNYPHRKDKLPKIRELLESIC